MKHLSTQQATDRLLHENKILSITLYVLAALAVVCGNHHAWFWTVAEPAHSCAGLDNRDVPIHPGLAFRPGTAT